MLNYLHLFCIKRVKYFKVNQRIVILVVLSMAWHPAQTQGCKPMSPFPCDSIQVNLPYKLIFDNPITGTASGFYSKDNGKTFQNVGNGYAVSSISLTGMELTNSTTYTGIFASYRNGNSPITYTFDNFTIAKPQHIELPDYEFTVTDAWMPGALVGKLTAVCADNHTVNYSIQSGNTNSTFILDANNGNLTLGRRVNHHAQSAFTVNVVAVAGQQPDIARVTIEVRKDGASEPIQAINWSAATSQPYKVGEAQGEVVNGKLYSFGGFDSQKSGFTPTKRAYVYDPVTNKWSPIADLPHTPNGSGFGGVTHAGLANNGTNIYLAGGYTSNSTGTGQTFGTQQVWRYNVASNTYNKLPDLPAPGNYGLGHISSSVVTIGDQIIVMGGEAVHQTNVSALVSAYSPANNTWTSLTSLPAPRFSGVAAALNGNLYYTGGSKTNTTYKGTPAASGAASKMGTSQNIEEQSSDAATSKMTIFPNPAYNSNFNIQLENFGTNQQVAVSVIDSSGKVVLRKKNQQMKMEQPAWNSRL